MNTVSRAPSYQNVVLRLLTSHLLRIADRKTWYKVLKKTTKMGVSGILKIYVDYNSVFTC